MVDLIHANSTNDGEAEAYATIEGSIMNEPCNVTLVGQFLIVGEEEAQTFVVQKKVLALLTLLGIQEFVCTIQGGHIIG